MDGIVNININNDSYKSQEVTIDYSKRNLDICGVCKLKYNVGDRIPRILVNCGHTYCTSCFSRYYRKNRIRCPYCKKIVKSLESIEQLTLNINLFSEVVRLDPTLLILMDPESNSCYSTTCSIHSEKQKHFYCSYHETNFCRECIKAFHRDDQCCVVDLYDISKLFQLNDQNDTKNQLIVRTRNRKKMKEEFFIANA